MELNLITVTEAAERKGVTRAAIYTAITDGRLTKHERYGKTLVSATEIEAWIPYGGYNRPSAKEVRLKRRDNTLKEL